MVNEMLQQLKLIERILREQSACNKHVLDVDEACSYMKVSRSFLYKMTHERKIACYCPSGKKLYFKREDLDEWMLQNRQKPEFEIEQDALSIIKIRSRKPP